MSKIISHHCVSRRCRKYHVPERYALTPEEVRVTTERFITCARCLEPLHMIPERCQTCRK
jgi:hypothetical protein